VTKRICVIDGQGGGIGATLIKYLKETLGEDVRLIALGTNAIAAAKMLKAGANKGASGENAVCKGISEADCIIGPIAIMWANAMLGEVTPKMAEALSSSPAKKDPDSPSLRRGLRSWVCPENPCRIWCRRRWFE